MLTHEELLNKFYFLYQPTKYEKIFIFPIKMSYPIAKSSRYQCFFLNSLKEEVYIYLDCLYSKKDDALKVNKFFRSDLRGVSSGFFNSLTGCIKRGIKNLTNTDNLQPISLLLTHKNSALRELVKTILGVSNEV